MDKYVNFLWRNVDNSPNFNLSTNYAQSCTQSYPQADRYLVNKGANINVQHNEGDTPVQFAGKNENRSMIRFFLENRDKNKLDK